MTITQLRGDTIFATMEKIHLFPAYLSRQDYEARTGRTCPAYDPTRSVKRWEDPDALSSPSTVTYDVIRIDTGSKCIMNNSDGNPCFEKMALPSTEAFRVNLPPSVGTDPNINGEIRMPCRVLNAEWREEFVWNNGLPTVRIKDRPVDPMQQVIEALGELKRGQDRIEAAIAELQASKGLLAQIAESFGKKKGVDAAAKV